jgi:hypothetical protein
MSSLFKPLSFSCSICGKKCSVTADRCKYCGKTVCLDCIKQHAIEQHKRKEVRIFDGKQKEITTQSKTE